MRDLVIKKYVWPMAIINLWMMVLRFIRDILELTVNSTVLTKTRHKNAFAEPYVISG